MPDSAVDSADGVNPLSTGSDLAIEAAIDQFAALYPFSLDDFQREAIRVLLDGESVMVAAPTGTGKALAVDTPVLTPTGWTRIGELRPGDNVIGADGRPTKVRGVFPQGIRAAYRVTFSDGASVVCDLDHLWTVNTKSRRHEELPWRLLTLAQILAEGLADGKGYRHFIPLVEPVQFVSDELADEPVSLHLARTRTPLTQRQLAARLGVSQTMVAYWETGRRPMPAGMCASVSAAVEEAGPRPRLDPYLLGLLLGDGCFSVGILSFSSADHEIVESVRAKLPPGAMLKRLASRPYDWQIVSARTRCRNPAMDALRALGLLGHRAESKFVPRSYKLAPVAERVALLQGLLDSDGGVDTRGLVEYTTVSARLAEDVAFLVRSLGGRTRIRTKETGYQLAYRLHISMPAEVVPFTLHRKRKRYFARPRRRPTRAIASVEPVGEAEVVCISVEASDGLFVVNDFIVTHNTIVAEFAIYDAIKRTGRVLYTTPIKALSNQKYRDLRAIYGDAVGLLTGDVSENRDAQVVVMTTEVLRNMLLQTPWDLDAVECVIFDEIHYLADPERGTTWEEAIILCPEHVQLVCLSATVANADEIAAWIARTHRKITLVTSIERAVPLALHYFVDGKLHLAVDHTGTLVKDFPHTGGELRRQATRGGPPRRRMAERANPEMDEPQPREIVDALSAKDLLPAIYFLFSRNDCQSYAERLAVMRPHLVTPRQLSLIEQTIDAVLAGLRVEDRELEQVRIISGLARKGIGFHHAGLLPILKQLVEVLFSRGLMEVVFATDTLALGVNMPARTVVVGRMSKWDGRRRRPLIPNEFQQMAGRAGRRGMDRLGHVVVPYSPWFTFRDTLTTATGELHPVRSAFSVRYNTVLNLWDPPRGDRVRHMLQQSLAQFQTSQRLSELEDAIIDISQEIDRVPQGCLIGLDAGDELLEEYRRLTRSLTAAQSKERRFGEDQEQVRRSVETATPWLEPGRQALRRAFRTATPGLVAHSRQWGWGIYLGRGAQGGVGRFLFGETIRLLAEYRQIDYLTDQSVDLPRGLVEPPDTVTDATMLLPSAEIEALWEDVGRLELPDLDALAAAHQGRERERVAVESQSLAEQLTGAHEQKRTLQRERQTHPCHSCPRRKEHRDYLAQVDRLDKERRGLEESLSREIEAEETRIRGVIRGIRNVLHRFGYLHRGYPTAKADMLAEVFDTDGLILCELVDRGVLDHLPPEDVAEVFAWFSFDRDFRYGNSFVLPDRLVLARRRIEDVEHGVLGEERAEGLIISEGHNPSFYGAARAWCHGATMVEIGEAIELSEGDLVLTFNKTIDLMRQVREMLTNIVPEHPLRPTLAAAEGLLRRGIVEQSLTLGFAPIELPSFEAELEPEPELEPETVIEPEPPVRRTSRRAKAPATPGEKSAKAKSTTKARPPRPRSAKRPKKR